MFDQAKNANYELACIDVFEVSGKVYFNAVFRPKTGAQWAAFHNLTGQQYQDKLNKYTKAAYRLTQVESYSIGKSVHYAAIFKKAPGAAFTAYHGLTPRITKSASTT